MNDFHFNAGVKKIKIIYQYPRHLSLSLCSSYRSQKITRIKINASLYYTDVHTYKLLVMRRFRHETQINNKKCASIAFCGANTFDEKWKSYLRKMMIVIIFEWASVNHRHWNFNNNRHRLNERWGNITFAISVSKYPTWMSQSLSRFNGQKKTDTHTHTKTGNF